MSEVNGAGSEIEPLKAITSIPIPEAFRKAGSER
jgi:hypothetical protein